MPFKASRRHAYWSIDARYIEEHLLEDPKPVYVITVFENFSRMVLSSTISPTQNQWDYLSVLTDAIRGYGAPEAIVTDGGGIFYSNAAMQLYDMLGIGKERIEAGEPWQNYAETLVKRVEVNQEHVNVKRAAESQISELKSFANGIRRDYAAVQAAFLLPWNNGVVEGHVNRLKFLKRQMFGRARLDLLRVKVLHAIEYRASSRLDIIQSDRIAMRPVLKRDAYR